MRTFFASVVAIALGTIAANPQAPVNPQFDVASIKPSADSNDGPRGFSFSPSGRFAWNRMTLRQLISTAYGDGSFKDVVGGPSWVDSSRFDIAATSPEALKEPAPDGAPRGVFLRLRALLEDRFQLRSHVEPRELPVFFLLPASRPLAAGTGLRRVDDNCEAALREVAGRGATGTAAPAAQGQPPPVPRCALRVTLSQLTGRAITMNQLADALAAPAQRPVIDRTEATGVFDVDLRWAPDLPAGALINGQPAPPRDGPSIFTAVREQLGLRLDATRAPVPVFVIDSVQLPSPD